MMRLPAMMLLSAILSAVTVNLHAQEMTFQLDPAGTKVEISLGASLHTVHGAFQTKSGTIHFNPSTGAASGLVVVDATSGDTGNDGRDRKMHREILRSQQYPEVTFTPSRVVGTLPSQGGSTVQVEGVLRLLGQDHPIVVSVPVQTSADTVTANTQFVVPYIAWGLKNPSTFLLRVSDKVTVHVTATGRLTSTGQHSASNTPQ